MIKLAQTTLAPNQECYCTHLKAISLPDGRRLLSKQISCILDESSPSVLINSFWPSTSLLATHLNVISWKFSDTSALLSKQIRLSTGPGISVKRRQIWLWWNSIFFIIWKDYIRVNFKWYLHQQLHRRRLVSGNEDHHLPLQCKE